MRGFALPACGASTKRFAARDERGERGASAVANSLAARRRGRDGDGTIDALALAATFSPLFDGLDPAVVEEVARGANILRFRARQHLDAFEGRVCFLMSGRVMWSLPTSTDADLLLDVLRAGDIFGDVACFAPGSPSCHATARTAGEAAVVPASLLRSLMLKHPQLTLRWLELNSRRLQHLQRVTADVMLLDLPGRLYRCLLDACRIERDAVTDGHRLEHGLRQRELAAMAGVSREALNKLLSAWRRSGLVSIGRGYLIVHRAEELARQTSWPTVSGRS